VRRHVAVFEGYEAVVVPSGSCAGSVRHQHAWVAAQTGDGALAEAARLHLRRKFLQAEVAVSGANFAVAETGTLAVVESEGNGRMCLTLPRVLITVMGIEKLLPAPEQALMTSAAWAMASPGRWARALRAARLGRLLAGRRRRIAALQERRRTAWRRPPGWWRRRRSAGAPSAPAG
jgi:LUD domain